MNFHTHVKHESKAFPVITFTVKAMSERMRSEFRRRCAPIVVELRRIEAEAKRLAEETPHDLAAAEALNQQTMAASERLDVERVRMGLVSINNLTINNEPVTPENLVSDGPVGLFDEISAAIDNAISISQRERGE